MLEAILGSEKKEKILLFLYTRGESYPAEIARSLHYYLNAVQNQLARLEKNGVLYSRLRGTIRLYGFNPRYAFKSELYSLLEKALTFIPEEEKKKLYTPRLRPRGSGKALT